MILTVRTDKPEAEIGLYAGSAKVAYQQWHAHRELAETLHQKIKALLDDQHEDWSDIAGIVLYKGPGSFTGLRIGAAVANTLAASLSVGVVGTSGTDWIDKGLQMLQNGDDHGVVVPEYGAGAHITAPKK